MTSSLVLTALASASALAAGAFAIRQRFASLDAAAEWKRQTSVMRQQRDAAERRLKDALAEGARLRRLSLAGAHVSSEAVYSDRPSPRDAEALVRLARGLGLVDDVVLADARGLSLSREQDARSADLAALAPAALPALRALDASGLPVVELRLETFTGTRVTARPLAGRASGTLLLVRTTSQPVSALLVDAVAHAASRADETPAAPTTLPSLALTGSTDLTDAGAGLSRTAMAPFERALAGDHRGLVVLARGMIVLSGASNGPSEASRSIVAHALGSLVDRAARTLREPLLARAELVLDDGRTVGWAAFAPRSHLALVTFTDDGVGTSAKVDRLVGALRRSFDEQPGAALAALAAHGAA